MASMSDDKFKEKLYNLALLGRITSRTAFRGHATVHLGGSTTATYTATATFEGSPARIQVDLIRSNGTWTISDLRVIVPINGEERALQFA
jgi:hypothetical protein